MGREYAGNKIQIPGGMRVMITAKIVKYYNDYNQKAFDKMFENLDELADWIFDQMQLDYTKKPGCDFLTFPTNRFGKWYEISVRPNYGGYVYWIHEIDSESGIIFSSGKYTAGKDFCAEKVQEWFQKCEERKKHPKFNFVEV